MYDPPTGTITSYNFSAYIKCDEHIECSGELYTGEICASTKKKEDEPREDKEEATEGEPEKVSPLDVWKDLRVTQAYLQEENIPSHISSFDNVT